MLDAQNPMLIKPLKHCFNIGLELTPDRIGMMLFYQATASIATQVTVVLQKY
jgi:hypothetical protein